ncbi:hypothetical protein AADG42_04010 [Ammonicoccus fulvus]|uniref:Uncharacterized protein n=1 Tax=Ammonicoccus fulvus TaxID=3138240 RepID=A0ABZ3FKD9_9ACTN
MTDGAVVALVGPSGTGKSTAARTLCRDHFGYVSDETVALRPDGSVVPFPKPIALLPPSGGMKTEFGPDELELLPCPADLRLDGIISLERDGVCENPTIQELGLLQGLITLVPDMSALPQLETPLAWLARVVEQCGGVHRVRYRNADQLYEPILDVLAASSKASGFTHHPSSTSEVDVPPGHVRRSSYTDAIELDGEVLLIQGSECLLLSGIGGLIWLAAGNPCTLDQVLRELTATVGDHPEARRLAEDVIRELETMGVLLSGATAPREHGTA